MADTRKQHRESIAAIAKNALKDHVLITEQDQGPVRMWYCGKPGTGMYSFRVIAAPGFICVYGDVGDGMLMAYDRDLVPWLKDAIKSPDYLLGKMINKKEQFFPGDAEQLLKDMIEDSTDEEDKKRNEELVEKIQDEWADGADDSTGYNFGKAIYNAGLDTELMDCTMDYCSDNYWTVECLKKFVELYKEF